MLNAIRALIAPPRTAQPSARPSIEERLAVAKPPRDLTPSLNTWLRRNLGRPSGITPYAEMQDLAEASRRDADRRSARIRRRHT